MQRVRAAVTFLAAALCVAVPAVVLSAATEASETVAARASRTGDDALAMDITAGGSGPLAPGTTVPPPPPPPKPGGFPPKGFDVKKNEKI